MSRHMQHVPEPLVYSSFLNQIITVCFKQWTANLIIAYRMFPPDSTNASKIFMVEYEKSARSRCGKSRTLLFFEDRHTYQTLHGAVVQIHRQI